ncbi:type II secretion system F family protein [Patescibacteria group bacterium]|nr:type II secretion system F family protein [Patescibacteria group bacterium]
MLFNYKALDEKGEEKAGSIEALNIDIAINSLQKRGLIISQIKDADGGSLFERKFSFFSQVSNKDIVILSRQIATMFEAQVSALRVFQLIGSQIQKPSLRKVIAEVASDIQGGSSISDALYKHHRVFSDFYVNMVRSGEESGKLDQTFLFLADYLDRSYEITSKVKNALVYPIFIVFTFLAVMILMFTAVIPKISAILVDSGQKIPSYTKVVMGISNFLVNYGVFLLILLVISSFFFYRYGRTREGRLAIDKFKLSIPLANDLFRKLYLSRFSDNMNTMLTSGISMLRGLELTSKVIGNEVYREILENSVESVKGGSSLSDSLARQSEIPGILIQMIKIGEETGQLGSILKTLSNFYRREVINSVDTIVGLIEPIMIVTLGAGVGILLSSVLIPIYNISSAM